MVITKENDLNAVGVSYHNLVGFSYLSKESKRRYEEKDNFKVFYCIE